MRIVTYPTIAGASYRRRARSGPLPGARNPGVRVTVRLSADVLAALPTRPVVRDAMIDNAVRATLGLRRAQRVIRTSAQKSADL